MSPLALGFEVLRPEWALALGAAPLLALAALWAVARRARERARLVAPRHLARLVPGWSAAKARSRGLLAALGALLLALALLGPVRGWTVREVERRGLDLVVAFDTSRSMLAQDLRPDRLARAQREVRGLLRELKGDRVALLGFAGDVRLVAPLTHDRTTLAQLVDGLSPADNRVGGTNLGGAIDRALELFDGRTGAHEAIVLVTDGEDHADQGLEAARRAAERGIRIYVVGIGTEAGGKIPDRHQGFLRDAAGQEVISRLDASTLRRIAQASGGAYLAVGEAPFPLERLYAEEMSRLETRELWAGKLRVPHDRFQWPLALAVIAMLAAAGLRERVAGAARRAARAPGAAEARGAAPTLAARGAVRVALLPPLVLALSAAPGAAPQGPAAAAQGSAAAPEGPAAAPQGFAAAPQGFAAAPQGFAAELGAIQDLARAGEVDAALARAEALLAPNAFTRWRAGLGEGGAAARAVTLAEPLWDLLRWQGWPPPARAEVHHACGQVLLGAERRAEAEAAFHRARSLDPSPGMASDATYGLGLAVLLEGEAWRTRIPELGGAPPAPAAPDEDPPDALAEARACYLRARAALIEGLRLDWRDADTRANTELVQRRLRELDELERERQEPQPPGEPGEPQQDPGEEPRDPEPGEGESEPEEDPEQRSAEPTEGEDAPPAPEEPEPPEDEGPPQAESTPEPSEEEEPGEPEPREEPHLSREQIQRLLDRLQEIEERAEALREALRRRRSVPVERDW